MSGKPAPSKANQMRVANRPSGARVSIMILSITVSRLLF
jgi:hypothetical protein